MRVGGGDGFLRAGAAGSSGLAFGTGVFALRDEAPEEGLHSGHAGGNDAEVGLCG